MDVDLNKYIPFKEYSDYLSSNGRIDNIQRTEWYKEYSKYIKEELGDEPIITCRGRYSGVTYIHWLMACYMMIMKSSPRSIHRILAFFTNHNKTGTDYFKSLLSYHDLTVKYQRTKQYIYFINECENNITKIGISNNPTKRLESLQSANPFKLEIVWKIYTYNANELESKLHNFANQYDNNHNGEWFKLTSSQIDKLKDCAINHKDLYDDLYKEEEEVLP